MNTRERHLVELVTDDGEPAGSATVAAAHEWPGRLHRAFSVLIVDTDDRFLLQRRAPVKTRFANRWGNACCGHPAPGEDLREAAGRRLVEEIGLRSVELDIAGVHLYRAGDERTGRVEYEYDHVLVGRVPAGVPVTADPAEVCDVRWMPVPDLQADLEDHPTDYVPWLDGVLSVWATAPDPREAAGGR